MGDYCRRLGKDNVLHISIHANAAGRGDRWYDATGWCAYTTRGDTRTDTLATCLYQAARRHLPGQRTHYADCAFLLSEEGQQSLVDLHVDGICAYLGNS